MKYFVFDATNALALRRDASGTYGIPTEPPVPIPTDDALAYDMTEWAGEPAVAYAAATPWSTDGKRATGIGGLASLPLRQTWDVLPRRDYALACHAATWLHWERTNRFCPVCGTPLVRHLPMGKRCPACGAEHFPHLAPAVIVRIVRPAPAGLPDVAQGTPQVLLVHARTFRDARMYGLVAGFLEGGETLEECVHREVREETGLTIAHVRYFASQPWPYPSGVMVAFTAEWAGGELHLADGELSDARWCDAAHLPDVLPQPMSIARQLIDSWLADNDGTDQRPSVKRSPSAKAGNFSR